MAALMNVELLLCITHNWLVSHQCYLAVCFWSASFRILPSLRLFDTVVRRFAASTRMLLLKKARKVRIRARTTCIIGTLSLPLAAIEADLEAEHSLLSSSFTSCHSHFTSLVIFLFILHSWHALVSSFFNIHIMVVGPLLSLQKASCPAFHHLG